MSFPRYPAYKNSGLEWLGEVPKHWRVLRLGQIGRLEKGNGGNKQDETDTGVPCVRYGDLYTVHRHFIRHTRSFLTAERAVDYTPVQFGDVLFAASGETMEEIGKSAVNLIPGDVRCGGDVILLRPIEKIDPVFSGYALDNPFAAAQKARMGRGFTVVHIYGTQLRNLAIPMPSLTEQSAIANFLDRETAKIDALVADYRTLIELLQEKSQAEISHAVTKGLDPTAPMKKSGVEWLGDVPEHWEVGWIKRWCQTTSGGTPDTNQQDLYYAQEGGIPWIRTMDLTNERLLNYEVSITQRALLDTACSVLPVESVLIAMYGGEGTIGKNGLLKISATVNQAVCAIHPSDSFVPEFLWRYVQHYRPYWMIGAESSRKDPNISQDLIRSSPVLRPPISEQQELARWIDQQCDGLAALIADAQEAITLLQERRTALISAAVTGKIDVRGLVPMDATPQLGDADLAALFDQVVAEEEAKTPGQRQREHETRMSQLTPEQRGEFDAALAGLWEIFGEREG